MIQLENTHKSYFDCFEDCITSVIHFYKRDYMYLFAEAWRVDLFAGTVKNTLTDLLLFCNTCNIADKYCGLKSDIRNFYKFKYLEEYLIDTITGGKPVIFSMDLYDVTWSEYYHNTHSPHFTIAYEYRGDHKFLIFDATKQVFGMEVDLRSVFDGKTCTVVISETDLPNELDVTEIIDSSRKVISRDVEEEHGYDELYHIAQHFFQENNSLFDFTGEKVEAEAFVKRLLYFGRQRLAFADFLKHAAVKSGMKGWQSFISELGDLGAKWLTFRMKLMKVRIKGVFEEKKEDLRVQWLALVDKDKELYEKFIQSEGNNIMEAEETDISLELLTANVLDIKNFYNANAFNSGHWNNKAGFDMNGYYYQLEEKDSEYEGKGYRITFETGSERDHISCCGQSIPLMQKDVKAVAVIGSCENGDYSEELTICYEDGQESKSLIFPDWWEHGRFHESVVKQLKCFRLDADRNQETGEVYIFSQLLQLNDGTDRLLERIELPDCSNIHIFGLITYC